MIPHSVRIRTILPTYAGQQNQTLDGEGRIDKDSKNLPKTAKENTDKILDKVDKYEKGCKWSLQTAAKKIVEMTDDDWQKWVKKIMKEAMQ